jgi:cytochrome c556
MEQINAHYTNFNMNLKEDSYKKTMETADKLEDLAEKLAKTPPKGYYHQALKLSKGAKGIQAGITASDFPKVKEASLEIGKSCSRCHRLYRDYQLKVEKEEK